MRPRLEARHGVGAISFAKARAVSLGRARRRGGDAGRAAPGGYAAATPGWPGPARLDTFPPRWDDAAEGGAADGAPQEPSEPRAFRGGRWRIGGRAQAGGGVWADTLAGSRAPARTTAAGGFSLAQSSRGGAALYRCL